VTQLSPPTEVKPAFDRVAQAQATARARETDARRRAERSLNEAEIERVRLAKQAAAYVEERQQLAQADADSFRTRLEQYRRLGQGQAVLSTIWWDEIGRLLVRMRSRGRVELLDPAVGADGLDITQFGPQPPKR
jgi:regulator of protease activity HflC (stomatin/prohibitin superfamily)